METLLDIDALEQAQPEHEPFPFMVVPGFLRPSALDAVIQAFPDVPGPRNHELNGLDYGPIFGQLLDELDQPEWVDVIGAKLGVPRLSTMPRNASIRGYCEASDGHIHTDHWSKLITVLLYPNHEWTADGGRLRMLRSKTDLEDYVREVDPAGGTLLAFRRTARSYHGHHKYVGRRRVIQLSWLRRSSIAQAWQTVARRGTHLAKRLGLHPSG